MKKLSLLLLFGCMVAVVYADPVGPSRALKIASAYVGNVASEALLAPVRRGGAQRELSDTLAPYYIISRGDNAGFVIVSGDDCLPEIIGYTDTGNFVEEQLPPALLDMLAGYAELVEQAQAEGAPARAQRKAVAGRMSVEPIIKAHWHQSSPYNDLAPFITNTKNRALTGCTCTAAVMVLHHFRRDLPGELLAETPTYGYGDAPVTVSYPKGTPILWDLMLNDYNGNVPEEMREAVAVLNAAFGAGIWQTYGSSTSGQIANIVDGYNRYFDLGSTCQYKGGTNQATWEGMVYSNLVNGQPMVYAGVHPTNGGHAIVLDGYNAHNGLFHFNFGWGGQGDGYYTLDDETGVNGFAGQQGMVYNIAPKRPSVSAKLHVEPQAYRRMETTVRVSVTNHGTLDYSGFNLYWGTSNRVPSSTTSVSASNTTLSLGSGESGEFTVSFKPTTERTYYIYLTDRNCNVLDQVAVEVSSATPALTLQSFEISAGGAVEHHESGSYRLLHNDELQAFATIANAADATPVQTSVRMELMKYNEEGATMEKTVTFATQEYLPGSVTRVSTSVSGLEVGKRYALCFKDKLMNVEDDNALQMGDVDTVLYFKVCAPSLQCVSLDGTMMTLSGAWDARLFADLASDTAITVYDLTQVSDVNAQPIAANPNALFYTSVPVEGYNIVCDGKCEELRLQAGYNFVPSGTFVARKATFTPRWSIHEGWQPFSLPFAAEKPDGYICQQIVAIGSSSITQQECTDMLQAYTPYMVMTCDNAPVVATEVTVGDEVAGGPDSIPSFHAVVSASYADDSTLVYGYDEASSTQYFTRVERGTRLEPFTAVVKSASKRVRSHRTSSAQYEGYLALALAIDRANQTYDALHLQIEEEWNTLLTDSIRCAYEMFSAMQEEAAAVQACASRLQTLVEVYRLKLVHIDSPICYSGLMVNPSFEAGTKEGWMTDGNAKLSLSTNLYTFGVGMDGRYLLYNDVEGSSTGISRTVHELPTGYYRLTVLANAGEDEAVMLFAGEETTAVRAHPWGKYYMAEYVIDSVWVETGSLEVGVVGGNSWYKVDDFDLYYLGRGDSDVDNAVDYPVQQQAGTAYRAVIYDLFGRRMDGADEMMPGVIYIVDGRKVMGRKK